MAFFQNGLTPPLLLELLSHFLELLSHFFQNSLTKNFKNNFFTVFSLLAHWHLFAFDCFRAKKSDSKLLDRPRPPTHPSDKVMWKTTRAECRLATGGWLTPNQLIQGLGWQALRMCHISLLFLPWLFAM